MDLNLIQNSVLVFGPLEIGWAPLITCNLIAITTGYDKTLTWFLKKKKEGNLG